VGSPGLENAPPEFRRDERDDRPAKTPTAGDPLRGLAYLGRVALLGRDRLAALASAPIRWAWEDIAPSR
jgi:hypothetical protein